MTQEPSPAHRVRKPQALVVLLAWALGMGASPCAAQDPPPRTAVGGLRCVQALTTVTFESQPDRPHTLEWILAFPLRSRSSLAAVDTPGGRRLRYELGGGYWDVPIGSGKSAPLTPSARPSAAREFALRRAFWAWPADLEWTTEGEVRSADLGNLGRLQASDFEDGRPGSLRVLDPAGAEDQALRHIEWEPREGRTWPVGAELWVTGRLVWTERLDSLSTRQRYLDAFFQPPDRRPPGRDKGSLIVTPRRVQLPPRWVHRRPLGPAEEPWTSGGSWTERMSLAQSLEGSGCTLNPVPDLLLSSAGQPVALRWTASGGDPQRAARLLRAHGWTPAPATSAVACPLAHIEDLHPAVWAETQRWSLGAANRLATPYLLRKRGPGGRLEPLELIQPFRDR